MFHNDDSSILANLQTHSIRPVEYLLGNQEKIMKEIK